MPPVMRRRSINFVSERVYKGCALEPHLVIADKFTAHFPETEISKTENLFIAEQYEKQQPVTAADFAGLIKNVPQFPFFEMQRIKRQFDITLICFSHVIDMAPPDSSVEQFSKKQLLTIKMFSQFCGEIL